MGSKRAKNQKNYSKIKRNTIAMDIIGVVIALI